MLPLIDPARFPWLLFLFVGALLIGGVAFFFGVLKGKKLEARLQQRSQELTRSIRGGAFSEQAAPFLPDFSKRPKSFRSEVHRQANRLSHLQGDGRAIDFARQRMLMDLESQTAR
jgi:hypothetical protein